MFLFLLFCRGRRWEVFLLKLKYFIYNLYFFIEILVCRRRIIRIVIVKIFDGRFYEGKWGREEV